MKAVVIIQARMSSERLPEKVISDLCGLPMIVQLVRRVRRAKRVSEVIVATSTEKEDDVLAGICKDHGIACFRGSLNDVLDRFYQCAKQVGADIIVRLTGDNPLTDPEMVDKNIAYLQEHPEVDHYHYRKGMPLGASSEAFTMKALERAWTEGLESACREHVTVYMYQNPDKFRVGAEPCHGKDRSSYRFTVDTPADKQLIDNIYHALYYDNPAFTIEDAIAVYEANPQWSNINAQVVQKDHGYHPNKK